MQEDKVHLQVTVCLVAQVFQIFGRPYKHKTFLELTITTQDHSFVPLAYQVITCPHLQVDVLRVQQILYIAMLLHKVAQLSAVSVGLITMEIIVLLHG